MFACRYTRNIKVFTRILYSYVVAYRIAIKVEYIRIFYKTEVFIRIFYNKIITYYIVKFATIISSFFIIIIYI